MSRKLKATVVSAGVIYPAGTVEKDVDGKVTADVWEGDSESGPASTGPTVKEILDGVGDDKEKAAAALEQEKAGKNRKTLVEPLEALLGDGES